MFCLTNSERAYIMRHSLKVSYNIYATPSRSSICLDLDPRPDIHKVIATPLQQNPP